MSKFALLFLFFFFGSISVALFYNGAASFILYQLVYFLNPDARWWSNSIPGISYSFVSAILMILILLQSYKKYTAAASWKEQPCIKWILSLLAMYYIAYFYALNPFSHDRFTFDFTKLVIIFLVAYKLVSTKKVLDYSLWAYILGCTYIGYLALVTGRNANSRVEGIGLVDSPDANGVASALVPSSVLLMYYAWLGGWKVKMFCVFCGALIANGLVLINSRGSFLGAVAGSGVFLMYMFFSRYRRSGTRAMALAIAALGAFGAYYVTDTQFWERMATMQDLESKSSGAGRIEFWMATFDMIEDHPMGMGVDGYNMLAPLYMTDETRGGVEHRSVHSLWFQGLSEVGPIGFAFFLLALFSLKSLSRKAKRKQISLENSDAYFHLIALECALFSYLVAGSFINQFRSEILYWFILFYAVGCNIYYLQLRKSPVQDPKSIKKVRYD